MICSQYFEWRKYFQEFMQNLCTKQKKVTIWKWNSLQCIRFVNVRIEENFQFNFHTLFTFLFIVNRLQNPTTQKKREEKRKLWHLLYFISIRFILYPSWRLSLFNDIFIIFFVVVLFSFYYVCEQVSIVKH